MRDLASRGQLEELDVLIVGVAFPASLNFNNFGSWHSR
jgi:hypothetical protein